MSKVKGFNLQIVHSLPPSRMALAKWQPSASEFYEPTIWNLPDISIASNSTRTTELRICHQVALFKKMYNQTSFLLMNPHKVEWHLHRWRPHANQLGNIKKSNMFHGIELAYIILQDENTNVTTCTLSFEDEDIRNCNGSIILLVCS